MALYVAILRGVTITVINFLATLIAVFIADKFERKFIITFGTFMVSLSLIATSLVMSLIRLSETQGWLILEGMVSFIFFFAIGPGAYIWVIMSELLPGTIRSKALSIALFLNSMASAILVSVFLPINNFLGHGSMFYICGILL